MGGRSHWSQVKRQKGVSDAKRGQLFTKLSREISVAAREGGGDPAMNPRLRLAIDKGRENNMPADTIKRAIERGIGGGGGAPAPQEVARAAIDAGADDVRVGGRLVEVYTAPTDLERVRRQLQEAGLTVASAELSMLPKGTVPLDEKTAIP